MEIKKRTIGKCTVLDCSGELILGPAAEALRRAIREAVQDGTSKVVVNLGEISRMDSSGLGELILGHRYVEDYGCKLVILNLSKKYKELIDILKIPSVFEYFDDEQKALAGCE